MNAFIKSFLAGFLSTLVFHQGLLGTFYLLKIAPIAPFNMTPVPPLGVPSVLSTAFFGGLWGFVIYLLIKSSSGKSFWLKGIIYGAIGPTAVALLVVFPLKGIEVKPVFIVFGLLLNAAWGLGNNVFLKLFKLK